MTKETYTHNIINIYSFSCNISRCKSHKIAHFDFGICRHSYIDASAIFTAFRFGKLIL